MPDLDVCGLPPPEPFEKIMKALQTLPAGETLRVRIPREPFPLYAVLRDTGYIWTTTPSAEGNYEILITLRP
ncbi:MAG: hypothetical protein COS43_03505 [Gallionellales bacterium CG03_land_8_20_14_0_80_55_15]|nr:MAG: hypothetical protein COS43_03505 [Gallionellales bacterium CG03_land_8_20_14_0_80_55_15]